MQGAKESRREEGSHAQVRAELEECWQALADATAALKELLNQPSQEGAFRARRMLPRLEAVLEEVRHE